MNLTPTAHNQRFSIPASWMLLLGLYFGEVAAAIVCLDDARNSPAWLPSLPAWVAPIVLLVSVAFSFLRLDLGWRFLRDAVSTPFRWMLGFIGLAMLLPCLAIPVLAWQRNAQGLANVALCAQLGLLPGWMFEAYCRRTGSDPQKTWLAFLGFGVLLGGAGERAAGTPATARTWMQTLFILCLALQSLTVPALSSELGRKSKPPGS